MKKSRNVIAIVAASLSILIIGGILIFLSQDIKAPQNSKEVPLNHTKFQ